MPKPQINCCCVTHRIQLVWKKGTTNLWEWPNNVCYHNILTYGCLLNFINPGPGPSMQKGTCTTGWTGK